MLAGISPYYYYLRIDEPGDPHLSAIVHDLCVRSERFRAGPDG